MVCRRLVLLSVGAAALALGACATSNGAAPPATTPRLEGVGVLPSQAPMVTGSTAPGTEPDVTVTVDAVATGGTTLDTITDNRVFMEGDSVMRGLGIGSPDSLDYYVASLGWDISLDAEDGRFTDEGLAKLKQRQDEVHQVLVTMLGNNYRGDPEAYAQQLTQILTMFPDVKLFVMFTVPEYRPEQREVNDVLRGLAALDERIALVDWERITREIPGVLSGDGIHPTTYGRDVLAQAIGITLGAAPGAGPDVTLPTLGSKVRPDGTSTNKGENTVAPTTASRQTNTTSRPRSTSPRSTAPRSTAPRSTTSTSSTSSTTSVSSTTSSGGATTSTSTSSPSTSGSTTTTSSTTTTTTTAPSSTPAPATRESSGPTEGESAPST